MNKHFQIILIVPFITIISIFIACDSNMDNKDSDPLNLVSDDSISMESEDLTTQEAEYRHITFNEILNNPFQFNDIDEMFSIYTTDRLEYSKNHYTKPKEGSVEALLISGKNVDFGDVQLTILLNEWICYENLINGIQSGTVYILHFKIYRIEEFDGFPDIILWADLLSKPDKR